MVERAYEHGKALNVAAHFEIDDVIDPAHTRARVVHALRHSIGGGDEVQVNTATVGTAWNAAPPKSLKVPVGVGLGDKLATQAGDRSLYNGAHVPTVSKGCDALTPVQQGFWPESEKVIHKPSRKICTSALHRCKFMGESNFCLGIIHVEVPNKRLYVVPPCVFKVLSHLFSFPPRGWINRTKGSWDRPEGL
jgi:hypothetical protein